LLVLDYFAKQTVYIPVAEGIGAGRGRFGRPGQIDKLQAAALRLNMELRTTLAYLQVKCRRGGSWRDSYSHNVRWQLAGGVADSGFGQWLYADFD
jgi:hypothetical protein